MTEVQTTLRSAYLSGRMRGLEDFNFPAFHRQAEWLRSKGWTVFSPAERDESDFALNGDWAVGEEHGLDYFMQYDLAAVAQTDCVICMPGWELSQGARLEAMVAVELGHPVFEIKRVGLSQRKMLAHVEPSRVAAEFIAGTRAYDALPTVVTS
ncbi:MAG: DUF4406 domain-containing protein [Chloroflexi bacterium]|nr:DUF4406 domain-containing protein [Chloroflexota bacterium]